jgi:hypothetical protein
MISDEVFIFSCGWTLGIFEMWSTTIAISSQITSLMAGTALTACLSPYATELVPLLPFDPLSG